MILDNVDFKELTSETYGRDSRISSNRLKLRELSFQKVINSWNNYLKNFVEKKLVDEKSKLVYQEYGSDMLGKISSESIKSVQNSIAKIAKLEEILKVISKENVPKNYFKRRAIKLRDAMFKYLVKNSNGFYSIRDFDKDKVFQDGKINSTLGIVPGNSNYDDFVYRNVDGLEENNKLINVEEVADVTRDTIISDINSAMKNISEDSSVEQHENDLDKSQIIAAIDDEYGKIYKTESEDVNSTEGVTEIDSSSLDSTLVGSASEPENVMIEESKVSIPSEVIPVENEVSVVKPIRDNVIAVDDIRNSSQKDAKEEENVNMERSDNDLSNNLSLVEEKDYSFDEIDDNNDVEHLNIVHEDFLKSIDKLNETAKMKKQVEDEAQKAVQERLLTLIKLKEMKNRIHTACEEYNKKTKANENSAASILEGVDKMKEFIDAQRSAVSDYNAQLEKMNAALEKLTKHEKYMDYEDEKPAESKNFLESVDENKIDAVKSAPIKNNLALAESNVTSFELDEAYRIINDVDNSTLTELRWARDIIDLADKYTRPDKISAEQNGVLDSYGIMHAPSSNFGVPTEDNNAFSNTIEIRR